MMPTLLWHDWLILLSFFACLAGLGLLVGMPQDQDEDFEQAESMLMLMIFTYWTVHCVALGVQKFALPDWDVLLLSLKFTAILSYLLTFACTISLPLNRLAVVLRQVE
jgi:hypothetical protein|uniref:hypothetical protein n=1 Tax=Trichocoleus desertorum TaxID=1481672 RepID=UPI0025B47BCB|nr:hypothetical protein [Trichocoleus desertorum]